MRPRSLRGRLVVLVVLLLALATLVISAGTALAMRQFLLGRLDDELVAFSRAIERFPLRAQGDMLRLPAGAEQPALQASPTPAPAADLPAEPGAPPAPAVPGRGGGLLGPPRPGSVTVVLRGQTAVASWVVDRRGDLAEIAPPELARLAAVPPGPPATVDLGPLGTHRVIAAAARGGEVVVTGLAEQPVQDSVALLVTLELGIGLAVVLGAGVIGAVLVRRELRPLDRMAATATRVSGLPLDRGEVSLAERVPDDDPATEIGQVGAAFNRMLDHVGKALAARQASDTQLRRFVADASHELRTPLAAIRGYAELIPDAPEADAAHALNRITASAQRMSGLVEDLLLLARLDAGRPLDRAPVDLTRLVVDAVSDAHVAGPDHRWRLDVPPDPVMVSGDGSRLAQVLVNLLANARTHTPPGTTVDVTLRHDGAARLTVVDDGPGIPPEVLPHVFERFARGSSSRSREHGSTGLGLAIVDAVVAAHGGTVTAESGPGRTVLTVTLP